MVMEKTWVHLNRTDPGYEKGAWDFVRSVAAGLGDNAMIICPCIDCRNVYRHSAADVVDHLVTRGMDWSYKAREDWFHHGEVKSGTECRKNTSQWNQEILGLFKAAEFMDEELVSQGDLNDVADGDDKVEDEFLAKLADAETPLYPGCTNDTKLSAIVSLFRLKTQSGWSDKSFDSLLETLKQMLPKDNVLHTSLYEVKKFFRGPDGYCANISKCVKIEDCTVKGLKSHDYHVLMQQLLPVAIRGLLPKGVRIAIGRLCAFFNKLCQRVIDREAISVMELEIVETICMFERFYYSVKFENHNVTKQYPPAYIMCYH